MKSIMNKIALIGALSLTASAFSATLTPAWEAVNFKMPESVVYDPTRDQYYVSNVNMAPMQQDHNGSVGLIKNGGDDSVIEWV